MPSPSSPLAVHRPNRAVVLPAVVVIALFVAVLALPPTAAEGSGLTETSDTISVVKEGEQPSNAEIAIALANVTPLSPERVLIGRDDVFVDSMAAGVLQDESPLLLVPRDGPVSDAVLNQIALMGAGRVTLLGGDSAVSDAVAAQFASTGLTVDRRDGASRFETAVSIAGEASGSRTAILARAFPADGATDPTQAFADSLSAGAYAAERRWPIVLTQSEVLTGATRDFLEAEAFDQVFIMGGTLAISSDVEAQVAELTGSVVRVSGPDRFSTSVEVAKEIGGLDSAADAARVVLVDGQDENAWAPGFAAAAHAALFDAPVLLSNGDQLPQATADFLRGANQVRYAQGLPGVRLTCATAFDACQDAREELELPPIVDVAFDPPSGATVADGATVTVTASETITPTVGGSCIGEDVPLTSGNTIRLPVGGTIGETCELVVTFELAGGTTQTETATYLLEAPGVTLVSADRDGASVGGDGGDISGDGSTIVFLADGDVTGLLGGRAEPHTYVQRPEGVAMVDLNPNGTVSEGLASVGVGGTLRPRVSGDGRFVVFFSSAPNLDVGGAIGVQGRNVYLRDLAAMETRLVSLDTDGVPADAADWADVSDDGQTVIYTATGAGAPGGPASRHLYVHRVATGQVDVVVDGDGEPFTNATVEGLDLAAGGQHLAFLSSRPDLLQGGFGDTNASIDAFAVDLATGAIEIVSRASDGTLGNGDAGGRQISISADGQLVAFQSDATNLTAAAAATGGDAFVHDRTTNQTTLVSRTSDGAQIGAVDGVDLSDDGTFLVFETARTVRAAIDGTGCGVYGLALSDLDAVDRLDPPHPNTSCRGETSVSDQGVPVWTSADDGYSPADANGDFDVYTIG